MTQANGNEGGVLVNQVGGVQEIAVSPEVTFLRGPQGEPGPRGETGPRGERGADGVSATHEWDGTMLKVTSASGTSSADLKGDKGETGAPGETGPQGERGAKGDKGDTGERGEAGPQGEQGPKGDTGDTGPAGPRGEAGVDGYTPVRGTDYWTEADIATIKGYVDDAILGGAW